MKLDSLSRRDFLAASGGAVSAFGLSSLAAAAPKSSFPKGTAEACIFLWLGGGACHIDTFDPKRRGDPQQKKAGSYYDPIPTAIRGVSVCEHLNRLAPLLDRGVIIRSLNHNVIDEHAAATNRLHTGRPTSGTIVYPSIGSLVAHQRGDREENVPAYVVMGYPNLTRGPGFLGAKYGYIYLTETDVGPNGLVRPPDVNAERQARREALLAKLREDYLQKNPGDELVENYAAVSVQGFRLAGPQFMSVFDLKNEPAQLRNAYGDEFGQRCLLARRLVQAGARFVEVSFNLNFVNGTGWDTHNEGQLKQHILIDQLDQALSTLLLDLDKLKLLDKTLVVVATEFGRPPEFDGGGGRGHHSKAFSGFLAGGGLRTGQVVGVTDDLGKTIVAEPVSIPDFFATIFCALGINPAKELYAGDRPVPITDGGQPVRRLFG
ncbi:MAG: DUF1501 domain-containing protein [Gemmataceae bacterium]